MARRYQFIKLRTRFLEYLVKRDSLIIVEFFIFLFPFSLNFHSSTCEQFSVQNSSNLLAVLCYGSSQSYCGEAILSASQFGKLKFTTL